MSASTQTTNLLLSERSIASCDGAQFRALIESGLALLEQNYQHVNQLNVFPIPDGDTGTNMLLTLRKAYSAVASAPSNHMGKISRLLAQGALMEARGNSGVILSQFLRGLADAMSGAPSFDAPRFADALQRGTAKAYASVSEPTEGTILTVMRAMAKSAAAHAQPQTDLRTLFDAILQDGADALARTPEQLPILAQSGVVDSGGQGLLYIFQGMAAALNGKAIEDSGAVTPNRPLEPAQARAVPDGGQLEHPYDVQFLLRGENLNVEHVRRAIEEMGSSAVVAGDTTLVKVHVHVANPGEPLTYAAALGSLSDVVVENMQMQMEAFVGPKKVGTHLEETIVDGVPVQPGQIGVVTVVSGDGFVALFKSLRAARIVMGGQTANPSVETLLSAIESVPTDQIILLPNNKNILLAAEQARDLSVKSVRVVPTQTMPQGLSSMLGLATLDGDLEDTAAEMESAAAAVTTAELTRATRSVDLEGVLVAEGDVIGLVNGRLVSAGTSVAAVLPKLLDAMQPDRIEIIAVYYGNSVSPDDAAALLAQIQTYCPHVAIELHAGGQSHYDYILGAE